MDLTELKKLSQIQLDWALLNIAKDDTEDFDRTKSIIDCLKPWLNYNLYKSEQDANALSKGKSVSISFEDDLLRHGASLAEVKALSKPNTVQVDAIEQEIEREINGRG